MTEPTIEDIFPGIQPIKRAPSLFTWNGCGLTMYGRRDRHVETNTHISTHVFVLLLIPLFAFGAYRVQPQRNGWLFIGRMSLSPFAVAWNLLMVGGLSLMISVASYTAYTTSPGYLAKQSLQEAESDRVAHLPERAIPAYVRVARSQTEYAVAGREALKNYVKSLSQEQNPGLIVKTMIIHAADIVPQKTIEEAVSKLATSYLESEPAAAYGLITEIPKSMQSDDLIVLRKQAVGALVKQQPAELKWANEAAIFAEEAGNTDECEALLAPFADKLKVEEGARILGRIRAAQGKLEEGRALLEPYCNEHISKLRQVEKSYNTLIKTVSEAAIQELNQNKASSSWYARYKKSNEQQQQQMVDEWIAGRIEKNASLKQTELKLRELAAVVPAAMDLGIILAQHAQTQNPEQRQSELKQAEDIFLSIRGIAGGSDEFKLFFGQVCWWLGRPEEGRQEFDTLLKSNKRSAESLLMVANSLRDLGAMADARSLTEEAYKTAKTKEVKNAAALRRALCQLDVDDQILWLKRCDQSMPGISAQLAYSQGVAMHKKGDFANAQRELKKAIAGYKAMPRNSTTLNNGALAAYELFACSGDVAALTEANKMMEAAIEISPGDAILQSNLSQQLVEHGVMSVVDSEIDQAILHMSGDRSLLSYCYDNEADKDALYRKLSEHESLRRARTFYDRLQVIFSRDTSVWRQSVWIHRIQGDAAALTTLLDRVKQSDVDFGTQSAQLKRFMAGEQDAEMREQSKKTCAHLRSLFDTPGKTGAIARCEYVQQRLGLEVVGEQLNYDELVTLMDEALNVLPCEAIRETWVYARLGRLAQRYAQTHQKFADTLRTTRRVLYGYQLVITAIRTDDELKKDAELNAVIAAILTSHEKLPSRISIWNWAVLDAAQHPQAQTLAASLKADATRAILQQLDGQVNPYSVQEALSAYWWSRLNGDPDPAAAMKPWQERGVSLPFVF